MIPIAENIALANTAVNNGAVGAYSVFCGTQLLVNYYKKYNVTSFVGCAISTTNNTFAVRHSPTTEVGCPTPFKIIALSSSETPNPRYYICALSSCDTSSTMNQCTYGLD
jgi:hypothetical protein